MVRKFLIFLMTVEQEIWSFFFFFSISGFQDLCSVMKIRIGNGTVEQSSNPNESCFYSLQINTIEKSLNPLLSPTMDKIPKLIELSGHGSSLPILEKDISKFKSRKQSETNSLSLSLSLSLSRTFCDKQLSNIYIYIYTCVGGVSVILAHWCPNGLRDQDSVPGQEIPKTQKMVPDASLLSTQHYKVWIKGKWSKTGERSSALPYTSV